MKVWHDPQHGGSNIGCEYGDLVERNWVVQMATDLIPVLGVLGCEQKLARQHDETIPYEDRAGAARDWGAQIALLHHVNAMVYPDNHELAGKPWAKFDGLMTFALPLDRVGTDVAKIIGRCAPVDLQQQKPTYLAANDITDWTYNAYCCLIHYRRLNIPSVLIEWGFATSPIDRSVLLSPNYRPSLCAAAACGVARALEVFA